MKFFDNPTLRRNAGIIGGILYCLLAPHAVRCQSEPGLPVPEFYGIYAVTNGRLVKLDGKEVRADRTVSVKIGRRQSVGGVLNGAPVASSQAVNVPVFSPDLKIIVYSQSGGMLSPLQVAEPLRIEPLVFVRNVSVDTGFPNNVRRSGPENGWEYGNAPELLGLATGDHPETLELLKKPFAGQKDMILAGLAEKLPAGVYRFTLQPGDALMGGGTYFTFAVEPVAQAESSKCVDVSVTYAMMVSNVKYRPCSSQTRSGTSAGSGSETTAAGPSAGGTAGVAECSDYSSCLTAAMTAYKAKDWRSATDAFEAAAKQRPTSGEPWVWLGRVYLRDDRPQDLSKAWDRAPSLGATIMIGACHERTLQPCERGDLSLSAKSISFLANGTRPVFAAPPSEITPGRVLNNSAAAHIAYSLQVAGKKYSIDSIPLGVTCTFNLMVQCPQAGIAEQLTLANYVFQTLPKLASGTLAALCANMTETLPCPQLLTFRRR
jgi:hypothetical protein